MQIFKNIFSGGSLLPGHTVYRETLGDVWMKSNSWETEYLLWHPNSPRTFNLPIGRFLLQPTLSVHLSDYMLIQLLLYPTLSAHLSDYIFNSWETKYQIMAPVSPRTSNLPIGSFCYNLLCPYTCLTICSIAGRQNIK